MTTIDEDALYHQLRQLPDFDCFPLPAHWYKKYNIPTVSQPDTREFLNSHYTIKCAIAPKDLPPIIINEPQQNGKLVPVAPPEDIKVHTITKPIEGDIYPIHPSLKDDSILKEIEANAAPQDDTQQQLAQKSE